MQLPFYIAYRFFRSKHQINAVNTIVYSSIIALTFSTAAMLIMLSGFSGLKTMNIELVSNVNPEIKILPSKGKTFLLTPDLLQKIKKEPEVKVYSKVLQDRVYLTYRERSEVANMYAIDQNFNAIYNLDSTLLGGVPLSFSIENEMILGNELEYRLNVPLPYIENNQILNAEAVEIYVPKAGTGRISNLEESFNHKNAFITGVFNINKYYNNAAFTSFDFGKELLNKQENEVSYINIKLHHGNQRESVKVLLQKSLGPNFKVKTREDIDASLLNMINIERLLTYLLLTLVVIITTFTLVGSIIIIIIEKKPQTAALIAMGMEKRQIKKSFFLTGIIIIVIGLILGLILGSILVGIQQEYGLLRANIYFAYPVEFQWMNYLIVILTVLGIGGLVSYLSSRKLVYDS